MAKLCPACGRPNGDQAPWCLYCTELLPVSEKAAATSGGSAALLPDALAEQHLIILLPQNGDIARQVNPFAELMGVNAYDARLGLSTQRPRLFRKEEREAAARQLSAALSALAISHYIVPEAEVRAFPIVSARRGSLHQRHLELDTGGERERIPYDELLLLVRGEITRERHLEQRISSMKGASRSLSSGLRLHLYTRHARLGLEIEPDDFDWSALEHEQTSSALLNSQRFIERLQEASPGILLDRGFDLEPVVLSRAETSSAVEPEATLGSEQRGPGGVLYDNAPQFRFYARWRYRLERHLDLARRRAANR